jgi:membrane protease YdiL (CAAX protease family)
MFALTAMTIWATYDRSWRALGLIMPHRWRLALSIVIVLAALALMALQLWSVARLSVERRIAARPKLGALAFMMPRTHQDEAWFLALSVTAGFCEELLFRGYLPWFFAPWLGTFGAMAFAVLLFGAGHAYQGRSGAVRAGIAGAVMALIVLVTGSLLPAMIFHALIDVSGGIVGYWLLRDYPPSTTTADGTPPEAVLARTVAG